MKLVLKGTILGLLIALTITVLLMVTSDSNIFSDRVLGFLSTGYLLMIFGAVIGGFIAYTNNKPVAGRRSR